MTISPMNTYIYIYICIFVYCELNKQMKIVWTTHTHTHTHKYILKERVKRYSGHIVNGNGHILNCF